MFFQWVVHFLSVEVRTSTSISESGSILKIIHELITCGVAISYPGLRRDNKSRSGNENP